MNTSADPAADPGRAPQGVLAKISWRLLPMIGVAYGVAYMDRVNIGFAQARMDADLHFSATVFGLGGGLFFLAYALFELPSNLILARVGARRWLARIMLTWGVLAMAMMFVRTPWQFYAMRFLLGAAEAGFFPGVIFYLMRWFPPEQRGRAISRFYIAYPLSSVVMGAAAGALLGLNGRLGLAGWQWLFLVEGLPAVLMSVLFLFCLPESPSEADWLSADEKLWLAGRLAHPGADTAASADDHRLGRILSDPLVIAMGLVNLLYLGTGYAFALTAPSLLDGATHLGATNVGYLIAVGGLLGAVAMMATAWSADHTGERHLHLAAPLAAEAAGYAIMILWRDPLGVVCGYLVTAIAHAGTAAVFWLIPTHALRGRSAAAGIAAVNAIGMIGSFTAPFVWGVLKDGTGSYDTGLACLPVLLLLAAGIVVAVRIRGGATR